MRMRERDHQSDSGGVLAVVASGSRTVCAGVMLSACGKGGRCSLRGNLRRRRHEKEGRDERTEDGEEEKGWGVVGLLYFIGGHV